MLFETNCMPVMDVISNEEFHVLAHLHGSIIYQSFFFNSIRSVSMSFFLRIVNDYQNFHLFKACFVYFAHALRELHSSVKIKYAQYLKIHSVY